MSFMYSRMWCAGFLLAAMLLVPRWAHSQSDVPRLMVQEGHSGEITSIAISKDNRYLLTASWDKVPILWSLETGLKLQSFSGHKGIVGLVAISSDNRYVVTGGGQEASVKLWSLDTGEELREFKGHKFNARSVSISSDNRYVVIGSDEACLWLLETGDKERCMGQEYDVRSVSISIDNRYLAIGGDGNASLWSVKTGDELCSFSEVYGHASVSISPDNQYVVTRAGRAVRLWSVETCEELSFLWLEASVTSASISSDSRYVVSGHSDSVTRLWSIESGKEVQRFGKSRFGNGIKSVSISSDNSYIVTTYVDDIPRLWSVESGKEIRTFEGSVYGVSTVFSFFNNHLLTGSSYGAYNVPLGDYVVNEWSFSSGGLSRVFDLQADTGAGVGEDVTSEYLAGGYYDGTASLWSVVTREELHRFEGHEGPIRSVSISSDNKYLVTGSKDKTARLWSIETQEELQKYEGHKDDIDVVVISKDNQYVVTASRDGTACVWNLQTGEELHCFLHELVTTLAISEDNQYVVTGGWDDIVRLWSVETGKELHSFEGHESVFLSTILSVDISKDNRYVVSGGGDNTVRLWSVETGEELHVLKGHEKEVSSVGFIQDNQYVISGSIDNSTRIWSLETGEELARLYSFNDGTWAVIDPEGRFDASNAGDVKGLHWVSGNTPITLSQLKDRYYEPGLLAKIMKFNDEPLRNVETFRDSGVALAPEISLTAPVADEQQLHVSLKNSGGGIGAVRVLINGKELLADARGPTVDPESDSINVLVPISESSFLIPGEENEISVIAYNSDGSITSPETIVFYTPPGSKPIEAPSFWGIVMGVHDYVGDQLDLRYAAKDASDMKKALEVSASRLFGVDKVDITLLSTDLQALNSGAREASKEELKAAFAEIGKNAEAGDILVVYVSGHGVTYGGQDGDFYYLTKDAVSGNLSDEGYRENAAVSSEELTELIKGVPALKQLLILDTCGSGKVVDKITEDKDIPTSQRRALERMKDRTGMFVLAGSAANAVSYEATPYGQGLLTYSLLEGMRHPDVLKEGSLVDVRSWFDYAEKRVPELAQGLGGFQEPRQFGTSSIDIGQVTEFDLERLPKLKAVRPLFLKSRFGKMPSNLDPLQLSAAFDRALYESSSKGDGELGYVNAEALEHAYRLTGTYEQSGDRVTLDVSVTKGESEIKGSLQVEGEVAKLDALAEKVLVEVLLFVE